MRTRLEKLEAMARARYARFRTKMAKAGMSLPDWDGLTSELQGNAMEDERAAIRACHAAGGLVVGKMPGETNPLLGDYAKGWDTALAAVRAAAVEVE